MSDFDRWLDDLIWSPWIELGIWALIVLAALCFAGQIVRAAIS